MVPQKYRQKPRFIHIWRGISASFLIACLGLTALPPGQGQAHAQTRLPTLGDGLELTAAAERKLGDRIIRELYRDPDYLDDAVLQEYVMGIFAPLVAAARQRGELSPEIDERFAWEVLLGRDRTVNAFALPGGYFGLHLGLVGAVATPDELASVLAHELSHVTQRHISRLIAQQGRQTPLMIGSLILGALAASKSPEAAQALMVGGQALAVQNQLNFSRDMEREADRIGYGLMQPAGFAPQGFISMFEKLQQANRLNDNGSWPYLRSHPLTTQRVADMQGRAAHDAQPPAPASLEHALLTARARVLMRPGPDAWRQWLALPRDAGFAAQPVRERAAAWYAGAASALQLGDWQAARAALRGLQPVVAGDAAALRQTRLLGAELELAAGAPAAALAWLDGADGLGSAGADGGSAATPARRPELLLRTQALLATGVAAPMAGPLQTWVTTHPRDAAAWQLLAQVWQQQGQTLRAVRAEAEAQVARYDYAAAVDRFKAGQDLARKSGAAADHIEASIIDTRLRAVESLLREQAAER
ncbi:M48 family metalloprotease [Melaminivora sp.]|uniref:M48 family metalloprotease n=1 Tax=Melaminivora sp. TaxID=1933032 RepID=UPI0028A86E73|nr:M48 family metalloprotease [Melaminivora sp.]